MTDIAIQVNNLSKRYYVARARQRNETLREALTHSVKAPLRWMRMLGRAQHDKDDGAFWALHGVSFEVRQGAVLGIIGRNGAGKSTLLKILSRITEPTAGHVLLNGRVGSLLEVGTGFHPELTGRENVYLNGAILGMRRTDIDRKFDQIVAFSGVERFLDMPVKRYSSGMYVRLAFAVAAHLEPEILLVDEVLAVGDTAFQKKCLGKMRDVAGEGRTVLFISHNMGAINNLTEQAIYLKDGQIAAQGRSSRVIETYLLETQQLEDQGRSLDLYRREIIPDTPIRTHTIGVNDRYKSLPHVEMGAPLVFYLHLDVRRPIRGANMTVVVKNATGQRVVVLFSWDCGYELDLDIGHHVLTLRVPHLTLSPGAYSVDVGINQATHTRAYDLVQDYPAFYLESHAGIQHWIDRPWGAVHCDDAEWQVLPDNVEMPIYER